MPSAKTAPVLRDLVLWISREPRAYVDVMDAWRTHCPRLTIWEDASIARPSAQFSGVSNATRVSDWHDRRDDQSPGISLASETYARFRTQGA